MTAPHRWRDGGAPGAEIERMLSARRATHAMPSDVRARVMRRLGAGIAPAAAFSLLTWKAMAIAAGIGVAGLTGALIAGKMLDRAPSRTVLESVPRASSIPPTRPTATPLPTSPQAPAPSTVPPPPPPPLEPLIAPRAPAPSRPAPSRPAPKPEDTLAREVALLERARASFDTDPASTLSILGEHARAFPDGKLAIERELLAIDALERLGERRDARARADHLLERARGTIYEARIRTHLEP